MTIDAFEPAPPYTIAGTGPFAIPHPYTEGSIVATVSDGNSVVELAPGNFTVSPEESLVSGNLTLSAPTAAGYMGWTLTITRATALEQGWGATQGARERSLERQLDRLTMIAQERAEVTKALEVTLGRTLRSTTAPLNPFTPVNGRVVMFEDGQPVAGPTATAIEDAQANGAAAVAAAQAATVAAADANAAKVAAQAAQAGVVQFKGNWTSGILYSIGHVFLYGVNNTQYHTKIAHIATTIAADFGDGKIEVYMPPGAPGAGTGDMNNSDNLQFLASKPTAVVNLGIADRLPQPGTVELYLGTTAPPGRLKLNGATFSRASYPELWASAVASGFVAASEGVKTPAQYGPGNGSTTASLPDWRGRFVRGLDDGAGVDAGRAAATLQGSQNLSHQHTGHTGATGGHNHSFIRTGTPGTAAGGSGKTVYSGQSTEATSYIGDHGHPFTTDFSGGGEARPANTNALWVVVF
jgi:hypothetical protein